MTLCSRPNAWILEAALEELRGRTESENSDHVRSCAQCAEMAARVIARTGALNEALARAPGAPDVEAILARARMEAVPSPASGKTARKTGRWQTWTTLAAAASIAALLMVRAQDTGIPGTPYAPSVVAPAAFETAAGQDLAVIETDNPDITVLWLF